MSRQRVTGMRIPNGPRPSRTRAGWWGHVLIVGTSIAVIVAAMVAGQLWAVIPFVLIGAAYLAADMHS